MTNVDAASTASLRWSVYSLLIALSVGNMSGRILNVNSVNNEKLESHRIKQRLKEAQEKWKSKGFTAEEIAQRTAEKEQQFARDLRLQRPFLSSNDRSRWMTVRSLVELGTYEIDQLLDEPTWDSIDIVQHTGRDGEKHLYSSKPPLQATLIAGGYWVLHKLTGKTLGTHPYDLGRVLLIAVNVVPFAVMLVLIACMVERLGIGDFSRIFAVATAALGTLLTSFAVVVNNHLPAAVGTAVAVYALVRIWQDESRATGWFALCGASASFAAACELPALSFCALLGAVLLWRFPRQTIVAFLPAAAVVAGAFFATNYIAHDSLRPPYAHRSETDPEDNWYDFTYTVNGRERQSYWSDPKGIDAGEASQATYALHVLVGHHGIFSLTPVWLLSVAGCVCWMLGKRGTIRSVAEQPTHVLPATGSQPALSLERLLAMTTALLTVVCLVFYIVLRPQQDRNYGGMTGGFRWMFWFAPMWTVVLLPAADLLGRTRTGRLLASVLLAVSVVSVSYLTWNPWRHPWITVWMEHMGWVKF